MSSDLERLFLAALVAAGCTSRDGEVAVATPAATGSGASDAGTPQAPKERAFDPVLLAPGPLSNGDEYLGVVTPRFSPPGAPPLCSPGPCPTGIGSSPERRAPGLLLRRGKEIVEVSSGTFASVFGPVDTAEKALLRTVAQGWQLASCRDLGKALHRRGCTTDADGTPVRVAERGFEVVVLREARRCPHGYTDMGDDREMPTPFLLKVTAEGEVKLGRILTAGAELGGGEPPYGCAPIRRRGRMFEGYEDAPQADYLASAAREEAAAVVAFTRLAEELAEHGAPASLVERARHAAADERRHHAAFVARLGSTPSLAPAPVRFGSRSLFQLLLENAREGCLNETLAALIATHQASVLEGADRTLFRAIARDEREHAALAYDVHAWGVDRVSPSERRELLAALDVKALPAPAGDPCGRRWGEPEPELARAALARLSADLRARTLSPQPRERARVSFRP